MTSRLSILSQRIKQINETAFDGLAFDLHPIEQEVARLKKWLDLAAVSDTPSEDVVGAAVKRFVSSPNDKVSLRDLQLISFGCLNGSDQTIPGLGNNPVLFQQFLDLSAGLRTWPRAFRRCYWGLLSSYVNIREEQRAAIQSQCESLRTFLLSEFAVLERMAHLSDWAQMLRQHINILSREPTKRYSTSDVGDQEFQSACTSLEISEKSWIRVRYLMDQIEHATKSDDDKFKTNLLRLLELLEANRQVLNDGLRLVVERYACCTERTQNPVLSDFAVKAWGIPWLPSNSGRWFGLSASARQMIVDWLKLEFIQQFFSVLAEDGTNDKRRLEFWRTYHNKIDDMYFALGKTAQGNLSRDLAELRKKMSGRTLELLNGGSANNNAFIMLMGRYTVVEFGTKGNACFIFERERAPFRLDKRTAISGDRSELKSQDCLHRLLHVDSSSESWENKFHNVLRGLVGLITARQQEETERRKVTSLYPNSPYSRGMLESFCKRHNFKIRDMTAMGGNLWVESHETNGNVARQLQTWGFQYRQGRGWWRGSAR
jgi:hypothetical protein